jgi:hypothetical protein
LICSDTHTEATSPAFNGTKMRNWEQNLYKKRDGSTCPDEPNIERIYAFCTLTTTLSLLQSDMETTNTDLQRGQKDLMKQLKVLDALASVVIREDGAAAVIANPVDGTGDIQVLISITQFGGQRIPRSNIMKTFRKLFTQNAVDNPTKSEPPEILDLATLVDPRLVNAQNLDNTALLRIYLKYSW